MLQQIENLIIDEKWNCVLNDQSNTKEMAKLLCEHYNNDIDDIENCLEYKIFNISDYVNYKGKDIIEDYVHDYIEEIANYQKVDDMFLMYFDYDRYINDLFLSGEFTIIENDKVSIVINNFW